MQISMSCMTLTKWSTSNWVRMKSSLPGGFDPFSCKEKITIRFGDFEKFCQKNAIKHENSGPSRFSHNPKYPLNRI